MRFPNPVREIRTIDALLKGSEAQARRMGDEIPGAEHLLLSALELPDGTARAAFAAVGADPDALLPAVAEAHAEALRAVGIAVDASALGDPGPLEPVTSGPMRSDPSQQSAFGEAVRLSKLERPSRLRGAHVVIAVAGMGQGTAPRALAAMGIDPERLSAAARETLATP